MKLPKKGLSVMTNDCTWWNRKPAKPLTLKSLRRGIKAMCKKVEKQILIKPDYFETNNQWSLPKSKKLRLKYFPKLKEFNAWKGIYGSYVSQKELSK